MFSTKEFIDVSRSFVCIRIETYENKESEERVRALLNGRFANTAFCLFDPQGKRRLSRTGRSPSQVIGRRGSDSNDAIIRELKATAWTYRRTGSNKDAVLQDFLSFRQALNVASADQRLLVFVNANQEQAKTLSPTLKDLFNDEEIVGRFHLDFAGEDDAKWDQSIKGSKSKPAINIIRAGKFGMDGTMMSQLPLTTSLDKLKAKLLADNEKFRSTEERKDYASHVMEGKRQGIKFESAIPYGEDLDGDGEIDKRRSRGGSRSGNGRRRREGQ